ncbi:MAG: imidazole glycerol phosphate synthase subunit HisH [Clostridiales bacterium]|jgi:glutamine amidotransferase|nr:imidazole glycerol phosphate synthase subunit HisH [Clostridiales bacterium]
MIGIIDYGMGNLMSVQKAFAYFNIPACVTDKPEVVLGCDKVVLPGVGAFGDAMAVLRETGMYDAIRQMANAGKPLLGICLGMQLMFERSYEGGEFAGLGLLPGEITRLNAGAETKRLFGRGGLKIPHMGWNTLDIKKISPLFVGVVNTNGYTYVYFDHAYCLATNSKAVTNGNIVAAGNDVAAGGIVSNGDIISGDDIISNDDIIAATSEYGITFAAAAQRDNIFALQFHPEKSGATGLAMLLNFAKL